ncbi:MAG: hypothetical protein V4736_05525 [Bdellovibrionota bacterium]
MKRSILALVGFQILPLMVMADYGDPTAPAPKPTPSLVTTVTNAEGEKLIADSTGRTLYVFDVDQGSNTSKCNEACAEVWPPYLLDAKEAAALEAPLGSIERANKKLQLTYDGRPVYIYAFDRGQADEKGDGIGGVWHYIEIESKEKR